MPAFKYFDIESFKLSLLVHVGLRKSSNKSRQLTHMHTVTAMQIVYTHIYVHMRTFITTQTCTHNIMHCDTPTHSHTHMHSIIILACFLYDLSNEWNLHNL